jgi:glutamyl-tRNA reductase
LLSAFFHPLFSAVVREEAAEMFGMEYLCKKTLAEKRVNFDIVFLCASSNLDVVLESRGKRRYKPPA